MQIHPKSLPSVSSSKMEIIQGVDFLLCLYNA